MTRDEKYQWLIRAIFAGAFTVIVALLGVVWSDNAEKLKHIDTQLSTLSISQVTQGNSLVRLDERIKSLERMVYETKAISLGFKQPEIIRTFLAATTTFESKTPAQNGTYFIKYTVLSYDQGLRTQG